MIARKRTLVAYLAAYLTSALLCLGGLALVGAMTGCGGAAKQTNTSTTNGGNNNGGGSAESQPSR